MPNCWVEKGDRSAIEDVPDADLADHLADRLATRLRVPARLGFAVPLTGIKTTGVVRCDQPRVLDLSARNARKVDTLPAPIMDEVLARVATIFE